MNDGLIGLIILIAVLNIVGRIIRGFTKAAKQQKAERREPGLAELIERLGAASEADREQPVEQPSVPADDGPFSWLREEEGPAPVVLPPAPVPVADDTEFLEHPAVEYVLDDRLVVEPIPVDTSEELFETTPGMPGEFAGLASGLGGPERIERPPGGLDALVDRRFAGLRRAIVYSEILRPCSAARRRSRMRRYA